jgi:6-phosphogluconolactonase (cycloisomerase 2 family)
VGTNCALNTLTGGAVPNLPLTANPNYSFTDSRGKYLYVLNQSTTNTQNTNSTISAFTIDQTNGKLQQIPDPSNPYPTGAGPVCMVEDPTNQYVYTSNNIDGSVTGKLINQNTGQLSDLTRGSRFPATGLATCLAVSGNTT